MAITSISRMQQRRGLRSDLPVSLSEGELGWCLDTRQLFIGNSPGYGGNTEILTEQSENAQLITNKFKASTSTIASAITRPIAFKLNDYASVKDFGAVGDGVTDDTAAINSAIENLLENAGVVTNTSVSKRVFLYFPAGVYLISDTLLLYPYVSFIGNGVDKTIIRAETGFASSYLIETCDSEGNTASNIGSGTGLLPTKIVIQDLSIDTNNQTLDILNLVRYQSIRCQNVKFIGSYTIGDGTSNTHKAVTLQSIGTAIDTFDAQFVNCEFSDVSHGIYADDPVMFTTISNCRFNVCYRGTNLGETPASGGPKYTSISQSQFNELYGHGIFYDGTNPGISSSLNNFVDVGVLGSESPIYWGTSAILCSSSGDLFDDTNLPGVIDAGNQNLTLDPQQTDINSPLNISKILTVSNANISSSTSTGAVRVTGGAGIQGNLFLGGVLNVANIAASTLNISATDRVTIVTSPFQVARMDTTTRNLITAGNGDIIYNTTTNRFQGYQGGAWINLDDGSPA